MYRRPNKAMAPNAWPCAAGGEVNDLTRTTSTRQRDHKYSLVRTVGVTNWLVEDDG